MRRHSSRTIATHRHEPGKSKMAGTSKANLGTPFCCPGMSPPECRFGACLKIGKGTFGSRPTALVSIVCADPSSKSNQKSKGCRIETFIQFFRLATERSGFSRGRADFRGFEIESSQIIPLARDYRPIVFTRL